MVCVWIWWDHSIKVQDQVLSETTGILRKLSMNCEGQYPVTNIYKNDTISIQKGKKFHFLTTSHTSDSYWYKADGDELNKLVVILGQKLVMKMKWKIRYSIHDTENQCFSVPLVVVMSYISGYLHGPFVRRGKPIGGWITISAKQWWWKRVKEILSLKVMMR
jgi:hypothetical protein